VRTCVSQIEPLLSKGIDGFHFIIADVLYMIWSMHEEAGDTGVMSTQTSPSLQIGSLRRTIRHGPGVLGHVYRARSVTIYIGLLIFSISLSHRSTPLSV
jgi:hypothetical protein